MENRLASNIQDIDLVKWKTQNGDLLKDCMPRLHISMWAQILFSLVINHPFIICRSPSQRPQINKKPTLVVNGKVYYVMDKIGKGGSSQVFQVLEAKGSAMLALKKVDMSDVSEIGKSISPLDGNQLKFNGYCIQL